MVVFLILGPPPMGLFFALQQHNAPQKITFFMKIYDIENESIVQSEKLEKSEFYCFHPSHIGMLFNKPLMVNGNP